MISAVHPGFVRACEASKLANFVANRCIFRGQFLAAPTTAPLGKQHETSRAARGILRTSLGVV